MAKFHTLIRSYGKDKFKVFDRELMVEFLNKYPDKTFELIIQNKRTNKQNRLYWLYVNELSITTGFTPDEMHEVLKYKFLKTEAVDQTTGEVFEYVKSTTELNTVDFKDYIDRIVVWASEKLNVNLPLPNEQINLFDE